MQYMYIRVKNTVITFPTKSLKLIIFLTLQVFCLLEQHSAHELEVA